MLDGGSLTHSPASPPKPDFQLLFESAPELYLVLTTDQEIVAVSEAYLRAMMTERQRLLGRHVFDLFSGNPDDHTATWITNLRDSLERVLHSGVADAMAAQRLDIRRPEPMGGGFEERYWSCVNSPVLGAGGEVVYVIHRIEDVTDLVRLRQPGNERHTLAAGSQRTKQMEVEVFLRGQQLQDANRQLRLANEQFSKAQDELEARVQERTSALQNVVGELRNEIADRKRAEAAVRGSEERYRLLFESNPHPMWVYDVETLRFLAVNAAAVAHYGYSLQEFLAMTILDIRPEEEVPTVLEAVRGLSPDSITNVTRTHKRRDGTLIEVEGTSRELSIEGGRARIVLATDITERKRLQDQLFQAQKMEAIGRLAGGVAHDFNNLLTAIIGYSQILSSRLSEGEAAYPELTEIQRAGRRAADLTRQLLAFSRKQVLQPKVLDLNEVVLDVQKMLERLIGEDIQLTTAIDRSIGNVRADPAQIEQIILNLAINARDAMPVGGALTIQTSNVELDESHTNRHLEATPGSYVVLAVSDTGSGIDKETQMRIFEPFFTTKETGKGTGLGLSTVYGIVKQSGGDIWVYSEPGRGTTFKIFLPRLQGKAVIAAPPPVVQVLHGSETILLAEDEEVVRKLGMAILVSYGYTVIEAASGSEALSILRQTGVPIHLMITDVVMPGVNGRDLTRHVLSLRPQMRVLYVSGYTDEALVRHGVLDEGTPFLEKPFSPAALARKVRELLDLPVLSQV
jgi:hypothetical protein